VEKLAVDFPMTSLSSPRQAIGGPVGWQSRPGGMFQKWNVLWDIQVIWTMVSTLDMCIYIYICILKYIYIYICILYIIY
jgi:hypothetical protein